MRRLLRPCRGARITGRVAHVLGIAPAVKQQEAVPLLLARRKMNGRPPMRKAVDRPIYDSKVQPCRSLEERPRSEEECYAIRCDTPYNRRGTVGFRREETTQEPTPLRGIKGRGAVRTPLLISCRFYCKTH
jgi:hypothetical protein